MGKFSNKDIIGTLTL